MSKKKKKNPPAQPSPGTAAGADFYFDEAVAAQWQDDPEDELLEGEEYYIPEAEDVPFEETDFAPDEEFSPEAYNAQPEETDASIPVDADATTLPEEPEPAQDPLQIPADASDGMAMPDEVSEPESTEPAEEKRAYANIKPIPGSYPYLPYESARQKLFGQSIFYAIATALTGIYSAFWSSLYYSLLVQRSILFKNAEAAMAARGDFSYTIIFASPLQGVLQKMLYILPVLLLIWVAALLTADRRGKGYGSVKMVIAVLVLVCIVGVTALVDLGIAGLVFDVLKQ